MRTRASAACSSPEYQSRVSITSATAMPRSTVKVWNGLPCGRFLGRRGLGRHTRLWGQRRCHAWIHEIPCATRPRRRNRVQEAWNSTDAFGSGRAHGGAAHAALAIELQSIAQGPLAPGAARVAQLEMVRPAGAGGLLLGVAGAAAPNTIFPRHSSPPPPGFRAKKPGGDATRGAGDRGRGGARLTDILTRREGTSLPTSEAR